jgi:hypothetical protein
MKADAIRNKIVPKMGEWRGMNHPAFNRKMPAIPVANRDKMQGSAVFIFCGIRSIGNNTLFSSFC